MKRARLVYPDVWHFIPDLLWLMLTFALFQQELKQVWGEMWEGRLMEYFGDVWNTIDWTSILLAVFIAFYWVFLYGFCNSEFERILSFCSNSNSFYLFFLILGKRQFPLRNLRKFEKNLTDFCIFPFFGIFSVKNAEILEKKHTLSITL